MSEVIPIKRHPRYRRWRIKRRVRASDGGYWSKADDELLMRLWRERVPREGLAKALGRSGGACYARMRYLKSVGVYDPRSQA